MRKHKIKLSFLALLIVFNIWLLASGKTYFYRALYHNFPNIDDYEFFENRKIAASTDPQPWKISQHLNEAPLSTKLTSKLNALESIAFVVIKNDTVVQEHYWDGYSDSSYSNSFSAAKSHVSALIGVALKEGNIKSLDEPIANYLPSFQEGEKAKIKIIDVLKMSSGLSWDESYSGPFSVTTEAYYGWDIEGIINNLHAAEPAGQRYKYLSGDTQVLAMVLKAATGKNLSELSQEKLWQPMGYEHDAFWSVDRKDGIEKAYCCINSNALDFARLGKLYLNYGNWNGTQIIDSAYVASSTSPAVYAQETATHYGYMWWLYDQIPNEKIYYARGILGQYIIVIPSKNIIIVRLGHKRDKPKEALHPVEVGVMVEEVMKMYP